jgi:predicted transcriptional regulator
VTQAKETGRDSRAIVVQAVLPRALALQLKELAESQRRSVSAAIRNAVEDALRGER